MYHLIEHGKCCRDDTSSILVWKEQGSIGSPCTPVSGVSSINGWKYALVYATIPNVFV